MTEMTRNSSETCATREVDKSLLDSNTPIFGPEKVAVVTKSVSLQEMGLGSRSSLKNISENESSIGGFNSSGVFTCSVDISDVCMADLTKLSDSTLCSLSESASRSTTSYHNVVSTPLSALQLHSLTAASPSLTPIRSQSEFLSPQFGASDEYFRRNIHFISKQLNSLYTQLITEDKYFQACSKKYEEIISDLNEEIALLRNTLDDSPSMLPHPDSILTRKINRLTEECSEKDSQISKLQMDLGELTNRHSTCTLHDNIQLKELFNTLIHNTLPSYRSLIESYERASSETGTDSSDYRNLDLLGVVKMFDMYLMQIKDIINLGVKEKSDLSGELEQTTGMLSKAREKCDEQAELLSALTMEVKATNEKLTELECTVKDLKEENATLKVRNEEIVKLEEEVVKCRKNEATSLDQIVQSSEERLAVDKTNSEIKSQLDSLKKELDETRVRLTECQEQLDSAKLELSESRIEANIRRAKLEEEVSELSLNVSKAKRLISDLEIENKDVKQAVISSEKEVEVLGSKLKELKAGHQKEVEEFRIKNSGLILENSKFKEELEKLHDAFREAELSAVKSSERFDELQKLYLALNENMAKGETDRSELALQKTQLTELLAVKESLLVRLCSNFNELLSIFRECQGLGLDGESSTTDIDDGFVRLKRRLLDLSQDYITLNNRNKTLEKETSVLTSKLREKEDEAATAKRKYEKKCDSLYKALERVEMENKTMISQKIEQEDAMKKLQIKLLDLEVQGCQGCGYLKNQLQQLQLELVDKDSAISTLEFHIQSCCEHNRKKAQQYKHELHAYKRQLDAHTSYAGDFGLSPKKSKGSLSQMIDVGLQTGESFVHHLTGGFVERFKIRELEEKVIKLEKERTVLKRLCKIRTDRIQELESSQASRSSSSNSLK